MKPHDLVVTRWGARFLGRTLPCAIGKGGFVLDKCEGDGGTPIGVHKVVGLMYRPDRIARSALPDWARPIGPFDRWSDDPRDPEYNHYLPGVGEHPFSSERMARPDPLYDLVLILDHNWPFAVKQAGSAIFIHCWRKPRHPTEGCVAFRFEDLLWIAGRFRHESRVIMRPDGVGAASFNI